MTKKTHDSGTPDGTVWSRHELAVYVRALSERSAGRTETARRLLEDLWAGNRRSPAMISELGLVYASLGLVADALAAQRMAVTLAPDAELGSIRLFHMLWDLQRDAEAFAEARRFLTLGEPAHYYRQLLADWSREWGMAYTWNQLQKRGARLASLRAIESLAQFARTSPLDVNALGAELLAWGVPGLGSRRAAAIVAYRNQHGRYECIEQLTRVPGIGQGLVDRWREHLAVFSVLRGRPDPPMTTVSR